MVGSGLVTVSSGVSSEESVLLSGLSSPGSSDVAAGLVSRLLSSSVLVGDLLSLLGLPCVRIRLERRVARGDCGRVEGPESVRLCVLGG